MCISSHSDWFEDNISNYKFLCILKRKQASTTVYFSKELAWIPQ